VELCGSSRSGTPPAINISGNGFQNHCEKSEAARRETQAVRRLQNRLILRGFTVSTRGGFMKKQMFALLGLGLLMATVSASAQTGVVKANVPFDFIVNHATLPAGEYSLRDISASRTAMTIQSTDGQNIATVLPNSCESVNPQEKTKLVFHRYGSQYFLSQVWVAGDNIGQELPKSGREAEVAMDRRSENVVVVATLR
jgi:hypothetical protein